MSSVGSEEFQEAWRELKETCMEIKAQRDALLYAAKEALAALKSEKFEGAEISDLEEAIAKAGGKP